MMPKSDEKRETQAPRLAGSMPPNDSARDSATANPQPPTPSSLLPTHDSFTLVELLVVIGIMALVAAITTVAVVPMMQGGRLRSGSRIVQAAFYRARMYAAVNRTPASVWFYPEAGRIEVYNGTSDDDQDLRIQEPAFLPAGVNFRTVTESDEDYVILDENEWPVANVLVFSTTGGVDIDRTNNLGPGGLGVGAKPAVWLRGAEEEIYKVIEVIYTTGLTRTYDQ